jgi:cytochrome P450
MLFELDCELEDYLKPSFDTQSGVWKVYGFDDVSSILCNLETTVADASKNLSILQTRANIDLHALVKVMNGFLIFQNTIVHARGRDFLKAGLLKHFGRLTSRAIKGHISTVLSAIPHGQEIDVISQVCNKIPMYVMGNLLGLEEKTRDEIGVLNESLFKLISPRQRISEYITGNLIADQAIELIARNATSNKQSEVLGNWFFIGQNTYGLSRSEISALLLFLFIVGVEETAAFLGNTLLILLTKTEVLQPHHLNANYHQNCINEMLRYCGPIRSLPYRFFSKPMSFRGVEIPANSPIECNIELAHFDPIAFDEPSVFNPRRIGYKPIVFGGGLHGCLGRRLAYLETTLLLEELALGFRMTSKNITPQWDNVNTSLRKQKELRLMLIPY